MVKITGIIIIITAFSLTGFAYAGNITGRINQLHELKRITIMLEGELRYSNSTMEEALKAITLRGGCFSAFFNAVALKLAENMGESFSEIWRDCVDDFFKKTKLTDEDAAEFKMLGDSLGYLDMKAQCDSILLYRERLSAKLEELDSQAAGKVKMYRSLGVSMGILTAVILL